MLLKRDDLLCTFSFIDVLYHISCCTSHRKIIRISLCKHQVTSKTDSWLYLSLMYLSHMGMWVFISHLIQVFDNCSLFIFLNKRKKKKKRKQLYIFRAIMLCLHCSDLALEKSYLEILTPWLAKILELHKQCKVRGIIFISHKYSWKRALKPDISTRQQIC